VHVLHVSDLHFGRHHWATDGRGEGHAASLEEALSSCLEGWSIGALVVSGDLSQRCAPGELATAARELRQLAVSLKLQPEQVVVTPGNHDVDWSLAKADHDNGTATRFLPWRQFLEDLYTPKLAAKLYPAHHPGFVALHDLGDVAIVSVSSCLFENHQDHYGYIGKSQLERLAALLKGSAHRYRVVTVHHHLLPIPAEAIPPDPGEAATSVDVSLVRDGGVALRRLGQLGVQFILHGHKHDALRRFHSFAGPRERGIHILGAGSAGVNVAELPPTRSHHAQILTLEKGPVLTELTARDYEWKLGPPDLLFHSYDELDYLEEKLAQRSIEGTPLLELVRRGATQQSNWLDKSARDVMEAIKRAGATPKQVDGAYWWLIVYGVLRFKNDNTWWDKQTWDGSVDHAMLPPRGRLLLSRL
jgi:hypothetical protein